MLVAHNVQKGEWACQVPFFPPLQTAEVSHHASLTPCIVPSFVCCVIALCFEVLAQTSPTRHEKCLPNMT